MRDVVNDEEGKENRKTDEHSSRQDGAIQAMLSRFIEL